MVIVLKYMYSIVMFSLVDTTYLSFALQFKYKNLSFSTNNSAPIFLSSLSLKFVFVATERTAKSQWQCRCRLFTSRLGCCITFLHTYTHIMYTCSQTFNSRCGIKLVTPTCNLGTCAVYFCSESKASGKDHVFCMV